jgi:hypothetical protein
MFMQSGYREKRPIPELGKRITGWGRGNERQSELKRVFGVHEIVRSVDRWKVILDENKSGCLRQLQVMRMSVEKSGLLLKRDTIKST